jgi:asparaginyl-tRNA synthetase
MSPTDSPNNKISHPVQISIAHLLGKSEAMEGELLESGKKLQLSGWIKTHRQSKKVSFIEISDGSSVKGFQLVIDPQIAGYQKHSAQLTTGASITVEGILTPSLGGGQKWEMQVSHLELIGGSDADNYPLQKKGHSLEFLRDHPNLRMRSNTLGAVMRVRSAASFAVHSFFKERGFYLLHAPVITTSDCEGAGEMFRVTTLSLNADKNTSDKEDFFGRPTFLSVSGQLEAEIAASALGAVYTFGPTFRAENSNTPRHLAEFWMIEPEVSFCDLHGNINLASDFVSSVIQQVISDSAEDLAFLHSRDWCEEGLLKTLQSVVTKRPEILDYSDAITALEKSNISFQFPVSWGIDLQSEHERYLTDVFVKGPVVVINYPKAIKAFYMRENNDGNTVAAMDFLVPRLGEIIGGSQREERYDVLKRRIQENGLSVDSYNWYLDLRKFGTAPHSGFGLGFERLLMYLTGIQNIRDVMPFPRYPGHCL